MNYTIPFSSIDNTMIEDVGGKNASLGELFQHLSQHGILVPDGFATDVKAYWEFINANNLADQISELLSKLDTQEFSNLAHIGGSIRSAILAGEIPGNILKDILDSYNMLIEKLGTPLQLAVRSSATAEDLPSASFAGQLETYLNIEGDQELIEACKKCFASLYTDRAIKYRFDQGFDHKKIAISVGIQQMVRSDKACSGVAFTIDPDSGFEDSILITGAWGLGENVVQGEVNVDEFLIFKPTLYNNPNPIISKKLGEKEKTMVYADKDQSGQKVVNLDTPEEKRSQYILTDTEVLELAKWIHQIEQHYGRHMDIEWAKDGLSGKIYIVQARPETVFSSNKDRVAFHTYSLNESGKLLTEGISLGHKIAGGKARILKSPSDIHKLQTGEILITPITNPDWDPILKKAGGIVTERGGRTSHAAIVARELGTVAIVGTGNATEVIEDGQYITLSCAEGSVGKVYEGQLAWEENEFELDKLPVPQRVKPMLILGDPGKAFLLSHLPHEGIGLMRMEFVISHHIGIHPMALVNFDQIQDQNILSNIELFTKGYSNKKLFFVEKLAQGIAMIAAAFYPKPVIVRMSDFKTNEYANLLGGDMFEPHEENPMLGFRGASRYYHELYRPGFDLECQAVKMVIEQMGLDNVKLLIPFCRTLEEGKKVLETLSSFGLSKAHNGLEVYIMIELPSNVILAREFAKLFDGFSIGSNDLTQLTLGLDRDSEFISELFDERNEAVKRMVKMTITAAKEEGIPVGLCGQAPSDFPEFTEFLVKSGIDSISFQEDAFFRGIENIYQAEQHLMQHQALSDK